MVESLETGYDSGLEGIVEGWRHPGEDGGGESFGECVSTHLGSVAGFRRRGMTESQHRLDPLRIRLCRVNALARAARGRRAVDHLDSGLGDDCPLGFNGHEGRRGWNVAVASFRPRAWSSVRAPICIWDLLVLG